MIDTWDNCKVILEAGNGVQLMERIDPKNLPDLILVDLGMPEMNGYELIKLLTNNYPQIRVMVVTMFIGEEAMLLAIQAGAKGFLHKSDESSKMKKAIYEMMQTGYFFTDHTVARMVKQSITLRKKINKDLREVEIIFLKNIITEKTYKQIALDMNIPPRHVEHLRTSMFERFDVQNRTGLAVQAIEKGLVV